MKDNKEISQEIREKLKEKWCEIWNAADYFIEKILNKYIITDLEQFVDSLQEEQLLQLKEIVLRKSYWVWESIEQYNVTD